MNLKKIIITIISLFILLYTSNSFACSCMMPESPEKEIEKYSKVFIGRVESIEEKGIVGEMLGNARYNEVKFEVKANIKDTKENNITLETATDSAACGYNFEEGKEYIVYAYKNSKGLSTGICTRTSLTKDASEDLDAFKNLINSNIDKNNSITKTQKFNTTEKNINTTKTQKLSRTTYILLGILSSLILAIIIKNSFG